MYLNMIPWQMHLHELRTVDQDFKETLQSLEAATTILMAVSIQTMLETCRLY